MKRYTVLVVLLVATSSAAADYWPLCSDGVVYHYDNHDATFSHCDENTTIHRAFANGCESYEQYVDVEGRACLCGIGSHCPGDFEATLLSFDPPLPLISGDPSPGATWIWWSNQDRYPYAGGFVVGQVVGETEVTVPAGTFTCLHVTLVGVGSWYSADFYLDRELGPVIWNGHQLTSIEGQTPTETTSWGAVKSLFQ